MECNIFPGTLFSIQTLHWHGNPSVKISTHRGRQSLDFQAYLSTGQSSSIVGQGVMNRGIT